MGNIIKFFDKENYSQDECLIALEEGRRVGFQGERKPIVDKIPFDILVETIYLESRIIGYLLTRKK